MNRLLAACLCATLVSCSSGEETRDASVPADGSTVTDASPALPADASISDASVEAPGPDASAAGADVGAVDASTPEPGPDAGPADVGTPDTGAPDTGAPDAGPSFETCTGTCQQTALEVKFGTKSGALTRAQFGFNAPVNGVRTLHVEAHFGGDPACPTQNSPSPDRTAIFAKVPIPVDGTPVTKLGVTFLDFGGAVSANPFDKATDSTLVPVAAKAAPAGEAFIAFDADVTFAGGTMKGHVYATHCDSMDE